MSEIMFLKSTGDARARLAQEILGCVKKVAPLATGPESNFTRS
jgi:hypothetical protein